MELFHANQIYYGYIAEIPEDMSNIAFSDAGSIDLSEKCRWVAFSLGTGIRITPNSKLVVLATSRNIIAGTKLDTTYWSK